MNTPNTTSDATIAILGGTGPQGQGLALRFARAGVPADEVREVIMGQVIQGGSGQAPARQAMLQAGVPSPVSAMTINKVCGSGL